MAAVALHLPLAAQDHPQGRPARNAGFASLISAEGIFQVRYPATLVHCQDLDGENPDVWSPQDVCAASIPVCDSSGHAGSVLACLAYPSGEFHGSELQAAAFAVSRLDIYRSAGECLERWENRNTSAVHVERIRGVKFQAAQLMETQTGYVAEHSMYRAFHKGSCYELDVNLSTALDSAFAAEDAPRKLTAEEREKIRAGLRQALEGFRFLK
jgi:hypothetical protein